MRLRRVSSNRRTIASALLLVLSFGASGRSIAARPAGGAASEPGIVGPGADGPGAMADDGGPLAAASPDAALGAPDEGGADIALAMTDSPDPVLNGRTVAYTLDVTNLGPDAASNIVLVDTLPPGTVLETASGNGWECFVNGPELTCSRPALNPGVSRPLLLTVLVDTTAGEIVNAATVGSATPE